jgi:transposase-like protein
MATDAQSGNTQAVSCPHCHKPFAAELIAGGPERHRGFKCPHCKLFVPESRAEESRAEDTPLSREPS